MDFSEIVYKTPGTNAGPNGKTYSWCAVKSQKELGAKLNDGWYNTLAEAVGIEDVKGDESNPPTRKELEEQATKLEITFSSNIGDKKLLERINQKMAEDE